MSRLTRDGTAEPVSRDQILGQVRGQGNIHFPCSADHEQDRQPYPVDPYSAIRDEHTCIRTYPSYTAAVSPRRLYIVCHQAKLYVQKNLLLAVRIVAPFSLLIEVCYYYGLMYK